GGTPLAPVPHTYLRPTLSGMLIDEARFIEDVPSSFLDRRFFAGLVAIRGGASALKGTFEATRVGKWHSTPEASPLPPQAIPLMCGRGPKHRTNYASWQTGIAFRCAFSTYMRWSAACRREYGSRPSSGKEATPMLSPSGSRAPAFRD